ncbi:MAG: epoxyqueuosine reductase [Desulfobacteraceae bacterium]|nr:MAG: epoxyqueuosine reductase [Desulfobacteraceae bacterium]
MNRLSDLEIADQIKLKARKIGVDLCGIANVSDLKTAPSFILAPHMPDSGKGVGSRQGKLGLGPGEVSWPETAKSVLVLAVSHPESAPEMDWWYGKKSPSGNKILMNAAKALSSWIPETFGINTVHLPYHVEHGGIYLKDAAVLAGIGCIGMNNILLSPEYGPRVRLRALTLDSTLPPDGPTDFDPCMGCKLYCVKACPQNAFENKVFSKKDYYLDHLPGRTGHFSRPTCNTQMQKDVEEAEHQQVEGFDEPVKIVKYCRQCELACPVGKTE